MHALLCCVVFILTMAEDASTCKSKKKAVEITGFEPVASRMQSERSTTELYPQPLLHAYREINNFTNCVCHLTEWRDKVGTLRDEGKEFQRRKVVNKRETLPQNGLRCERCIRVLAYLEQLFVGCCFQEIWVCTDCKARDWLVACVQRRVCVGGGGEGGGGARANEQIHCSLLQY